MPNAFGGDQLSEEYAPHLHKKTSRKQSSLGCNQNEENESISSKRIRQKSEKLDSIGLTEKEFEEARYQVNGMSHQIYGLPISVVGGLGFLRRDFIELTYSEESSQIGNVIGLRNYLEKKGIDFKEQGKEKAEKALLRIQKESGSLLELL